MAWCFAVLIGSPIAHAADPLPSFDTIDLKESSVSGLSSGAYMAGQFHVAFSSDLKGAAIIAGGPYNCAEGLLGVALSRCMQTGSNAPDPAALLGQAEAFAQSGAIDPLANLVDDRVYIFSGTEDDTVTQTVVDETAAFYRLAGLPEAAIRYVDDRPAGHAFITENQGPSCGTTSSPFINDCDYDQAGDLLQHIYGPLNPPSETPGGQLIAFDQAAFLTNPTSHGLNETGFVYMPADCASGAACRVHIAFHGCKQTTALIGDQYRTTTGYRRWADTNGLIVLFPEAHATLANPNSCWDWWGYDDPNYATKTGRQMRAVHAMLLQLAGATPPAPDCDQHTAANWQHWQAGRASLCAWWWFCAAGSGDQLGLAWATTTLFETANGQFNTSGCDA
jgi:poly(3-hydroxybutyrate) depolymerase